MEESRFLLLLLITYIMFLSLYIYIKGDWDISLDFGAFKLGILIRDLINKLEVFFCINLECQTKTHMTLLQNKKMEIAFALFCSFCNYNCNNRSAEDYQHPNNMSFHANQLHCDNYYIVHKFFLVALYCAFHKVQQKKLVKIIMNF